LAARVVVTGMSVISPVGTGLEECWKNLEAGKSGVGVITRFNPEGFRTKIAAEVKDFSGESYIDKKELRHMDRFTQFAVAAAKMAMEDAAVDLGGIDLDRAGVLLGSGLGGLETLEEQHKILLSRGAGRISPFFIPMMIANIAPAQIAILFGFRGGNIISTSACASSNNAIGEAYRMLQRGDVDLMISGGAESVITPMSVGGFCALKALSTRNDEPTKASRPFDIDRDGFVIGEGAGLLVMETLDHALKRGARIYGEVAGYGSSCDAYHITAPHPDGTGAAKAMELAVRESGLDPSAVGYIKAHGTGTPPGDIAETVAIKIVFGDYAYRIPVSSTKSMTGHLLGAAGGFEAVVTLLTMQKGVLPPTINLDHQDPGCDLDYVPNKARKADIRAALSNSFGFGGHNVTLLFKRYEE